MSKKRGTASEIVCPICGARYVHESSRRKARGSHIYESEARVPFAHTAAAVGGVAPHPWQPREPEPELPAPTSNLQPGETHTAKAYRKREVRDVWPPLIISSVSGVLAFVVAAVVCLVIWAFTGSVARARIERIWWAVSLVVLLLVTAVLWAVQVFDLLDDDKLISQVQEQKRAPEPPPPTPPEPTRTLGTVRVDDGKALRYVQDIPLSGELYNWLTAYLAKPPRATFSEASSSEYGVEPGDFEKLRDELRARQLIAWKNEQHHKSGYRFEPACRPALLELREMCVPVRA